MPQNAIFHAVGFFLGCLMAYLIASPLSTTLWHGKSWIPGFPSSLGPQAVCHVRDPKGLCVSWSYYGAAETPAGETLDLITGGFAEKCYQTDRSLRFHSATGDGGIMFVCAKSQSVECMSDG